MFKPWLKLGTFDVYMQFVLENDAVLVYCRMEGRQFIMLTFVMCIEMNFVRTSGPVIIGGSNQLCIQKNNFAMFES